MDIHKQLDEAFALAEQKKYDEALEVCNGVISTHPSIPDGLRQRASIYARKGDLKQAITDITNVIRQEPDDPGHYFFRGWWQLDDGDATKAVKDLTKALELGEQTNNRYHSQSAHFFRAAALLRLKRYDEALSDCEHVQDDFLIYIKSGKISKADIVKEAKAGKSK